ncbi:hypothetical protein [Pantoea piersonii]|uniref:hypothetical protein n=1 Tax=Pantoea piersonii TaxID=2364647 RepID=UPI00289E50AD|nr:hypothetical protein [Pantoea piersonii]
MKKLTAEKCRALILILHRCRNLRIISTREERYLEALEIALPVLEQQEAKKQVSLREGVEAIRKSVAESGGYNFAALRAEQEGSVGQCIWSYDYGDNFWSAACGEAWCFTDGGPEENRVKFCQGCGRPIALERQEREREED